MRISHPCAAQVDVLSMSSEEDKVLTPSGSSRYSSSIVWFENDGSQSFLERVVAEGVAAGWPGSIFAIDVDGNGSPDILSTNSGECESQAEIVWYETGPQKGANFSTFKAHEYLGPILGQFPLVSADFWTSDHLSSRSRKTDAFSDDIDRSKTHRG